METAGTNTPIAPNWPSLLRGLAPHAVDVAVAAYPTVSAVFADFQINTPLRQAHFLAQGLFETGGFTALEENLNYSAVGLIKEFPSYFVGMPTAQKFANNPEAIANRVYARANMGNTQPGDGWAFRGRGIFQLSGRANYTAMGKLTQLPLAVQPELVNASRYLFVIAAQFWSMRGLSPLADQDDLNGITKRINGNTVTAQARGVWLTKIKVALGVA